MLKKDYNSSRTASQKQNPKQACETINNLVGRQCKQTVVNQLDIEGETFTTLSTIYKWFASMPKRNKTSDVRLRY